MKWSEDGSEVTMSKAEYDTLHNGGVTFTCHCGQRHEYSGGPYADPPRCEVCECYMVAPGDETSYWGTGLHCVIQKRKRYPYLQTVVDYMSALPHQKESYVMLKVGKQFNLAPEEVHKVRIDIELMKRDQDEQLQHEQAVVVSEF
jgi:hypothetical protein